MRRLAIWTAEEMLGLMAQIHELSTQIGELSAQVASLQDAVAMAKDEIEVSDVLESDLETETENENEWHIPFPLMRRLTWDDDDLKTKPLDSPDYLEWTP